MKRVVTARLPGIIALLLLTACGDACEKRDREITQANLELMVWQQLKQPGKYLPAIFCPGPLDAHVGAETTCMMPIKEEEYDVHVKITSIDGTKTEFDIEVADKPRPDAGVHGNAPAL